VPSGPLLRGVATSDLDEIFRVDVKSALYGMQEVLPHFKSRNEGHVINISSMLAGIPFAVFRSASRSSLPSSGSGSISPLPITSPSPPPHLSSRRTAGRS
jgi:NAD(P)-dependent dehydrogenase (short-subunit alcohol dehydrogenase family)